MRQWATDVWEGFWTVLVGMKITWRHLFVKKATLHYPEEKWQLPPRSRMRLFMKYEDCIGCGQCARACPVQCIYIKADKRDPKAPPIFAANGQGIKLDVHVFDIDMSLLDSMTGVLANQAMNYLASGVAPRRLGNAHPNIVPYQVFAASDGHLIIACGNDSQFAASAPSWSLPSRTMHASPRTPIA